MHSFKTGVSFVSTKIAWRHLWTAH